MTFIEKFKRIEGQQKLFCHFYENHREDEEEQSHYDHIIYDEVATPDPVDPDPDDDSWKGCDDCYRWVVVDDHGKILGFGYGREGKKYDPLADHPKIEWFVALMEQRGLKGDITA